MQNPDMKRVFVVGYARSGTTLLQSLLAAHSQVTSFSESQFFNKGFVHAGKRFLLRSGINEMVKNFLSENKIKMATNGSDWNHGLKIPRALKIAIELITELKTQGKSLTQPEKTVVSERVHKAAVGLINLLDGCAKYRGFPVWVEKTPHNLFRIPLLEKAAPSAMFVHIIRRAENVIPSIHKASRQWNKSKTWTECALHWLLALKISEAFMGRPNHFVVFYEQLVEDTRPNIKKIIEWLGLEWEEEILVKYKNSAKELVENRETWKKSNFQRIASRNSFAIDDIPWPARRLIKSSTIYERLSKAVMEQNRRR